MILNTLLMGSKGSTGQREEPVSCHRNSPATKWTMKDDAVRFFDFLIMKARNSSQSTDFADLATQQMWENVSFVQMQADASSCVRSKSTVNLAR